MSMLITKFLISYIESQGNANRGEQNKLHELCLTLLIRFVELYTKQPIGDPQRAKAGGLTLLAEEKWKG